MKIRNIILICLIILLETHSIAQEGKELFQNNCAACHSVGKGKLVGPDLLGISNKHPEEWLLKWTKSSLSLVRSGDSAAVAIFKEFYDIPITEFAFLSDNGIKSIYQYIQIESERMTAIVTTPPAQADNNSNAEKNQKN